MAADKQADDFRSRRAGGDRSVAATPGKLPGKLVDIVRFYEVA